jgi:hypothetical protein
MMPPDGRLSIVDSSMLFVCCGQTMVSVSNGDHEGYAAGVKGHEKAQI